MFFVPRNVFIMLFAFIIYFLSLDTPTCFYYVFLCFSCFCHPLQLGPGVGRVFRVCWGCVPGVGCVFRGFPGSVPGPWCVFRVHVGILVRTFLGCIVSVVSLWCGVFQICFVFTYFITWGGGKGTPETQTIKCNDYFGFCCTTPHFQPSSSISLTLFAVRHPNHVFVCAAPSKQASEGTLFKHNIDTLSGEINPKMGRHCSTRTIDYQVRPSAGTLNSILSRKRSLEHQVMYKLKGRAKTTM